MVAFYAQDVANLESTIEGHGEGPAKVRACSTGL